MQLFDSTCTNEGPNGRFYSSYPNAYDKHSNNHSRETGAMSKRYWQRCGDKDYSTDNIDTTQISQKSGSQSAVELTTERDIEFENGQANCLR